MTKKEKVARLFELTGNQENTARQAKEMLSAIARLIGNTAGTVEGLDSTFGDRLGTALSGVTDRRVPELIVLVTTLYEESLSEETLDEFLQFAETSAFQKYITFYHSIIPASEAVGKQWGETIGADLVALAAKMLEEEHAK